MQQLTLITARLALRPFVTADGPEVQRLAGAFEIADTTLLIPHPYPDGVAEQWIATHAPGFEAGHQAVFAITLRAEGALVGAIGLGIDAADSAAELGYWIGVPFWGRGYATEAGRAVVGFGFDSLGLHRIHARHFTRNPASGRVLRKLGMRPEGVDIESVRKGDRFEDLARFAILDREWRGA